MATNEGESDVKTEPKGDDEEDDLQRDTEDNLDRVQKESELYISNYHIIDHFSVIIFMLFQDSTVCQ